MPYIKQEDLEDDGRWAFHPELGRVRSGPRGKRYREATRKSLPQQQKEALNPSPDVDLPRSQTMRGQPHVSKISQLMAQFARAQEARRELINEDTGIIGYGQEAFSDPRRAHKSRANSRPIKDESDSDIDSLAAFGDRSTQPSSISSRISVGDARADLEDGQRVPTAKDLDGSITPPGPPEPPRIIDECMPPPDCECPIDLECQAKREHLIDCRRLVPLARRWAARQQNYDPLDMAEDQEEEGPHFAALNRIMDIHEYLQQLAATRPNTAAMRTLLANIDVWIHIMQTMPVTENDIAASGAVPALEAFLHADNDDMRRAKRFPPATLTTYSLLLANGSTATMACVPTEALITLEIAGPETQTGTSAMMVASTLYIEGGHAAMVAGIAGTGAGGAYSVVMGLHFPKTGNVYADVDYGEIIFYMGTALKPIPGALDSNIYDSDDEDNPADPDTATRGSKALIKSHETKIPVRVFRSWRASRIVPHRPQKGLRYDGLYTVVNYELLKNQRQIYRFRMERILGQNPIHGTVDVAGERTARTAGQRKQERPQVKGKRRSEDKKTGRSDADARTTKRHRTE